MPQPKVLLIIQARMGATRLPGKVMLPLMGRPVLKFLLERLERVTKAHQIIVATTTKPEDDIIVQQWRFVFRGSEDDVLNRYKGAADAFGGNVIVRITSDCPLIDPAIIDQVIDSYLSSDVDYVSNTIKRTYPRGMDVEVFSYESLVAANRDATLSSDREHVTPYIYRHPDRFTIKQVCQEEDSSIHRWTLDMPEDYRLIRLLAEGLYPENPYFTLEDLLQLIKKHPNWSSINAHIEQKPL